MAYYGNTGFGDGYFDYGTDDDYGFYDTGSYDGGGFDDTPSHDGVPVDDTPSYGGGYDYGTYDYGPYDDGGYDDGYYDGYYDGRASGHHTASPAPAPAPAPAPKPAPAPTPAPALPPAPAPQPTAIDGTAANDVLTGNALNNTMHGYAGNDVISGGAGNDLLDGGAGADALNGNAGNDRLIGGPGDDTLDGGDGMDTAVYSGNRASYTITQAVGGGAWWVTDKTGAEGTDFLVNVERLQFADGQLALDTGAGQNTGEAYRLYQAAFNRAPDAAGLAVQVQALDAGTSLQQLAARFIGSAEFTRTYGVASTNAAFVTQLYSNVLHRAPDSAGMAFHLANLAAGESRADLLAGFSESAENQAALVGVLSHGVMLSNA